MKKTLFATVNGQKILGSHILSARKRTSSEQEQTNFAQTINEDNHAFLNAEALQKNIDIRALVAIAKFEGIEITEEDISKAIFDLRSSYNDEFEWETALDDLGIDDKNMRETFYLDMMVDTLISSHLEDFDDPNDDTAAEFYHQNEESMKIADTYTFLEIEILDSSQLQQAALILNLPDSASVLEEAKKQNLEAILNEEIPLNKLPDPLQSVLSDLQEQKIGTLPTDEDTIILVKLLRKTPGRVLSLDEALPGLVEYLKYQQYHDILDQLTEDALEKCDIEYHNTELLKNLY